jgi:hypothetical protein
MKLTWAQSPSTYTTGYKILRSLNVYGPWSTVASVSGRGTVTYTDTTAGVTQWIYRVESIWQNWMSVSAGFEAPPAVGRDFFDTFATPGNVLMSLDKQPTADGSSVWQVWSGYVETGGSSGWATSRGVNPEHSMAVVRTPASDAKMFAEDFDGAERFIIRGKDPLNFIYVGGTEAARLGGPWLGEFEIGEVRNGVITQLVNKNMLSDNKDMRVEVLGSSIKVYIDAVRGVDGSGTLHASVTSSYLQTDPDATYFGLGYTRAGFGISDFTFNAL